MSEPILFVSSNKVKFDAANYIMQKAGFALERANADLQEIQSDDGQAIVMHKAVQAYEMFQKPLVVSDDTWIIPGLNGFPGPYMKYMNDWLTADDFLRLTKDLTDRRIILRQHVAYQDASGQHYFMGDIIGTLLDTIRGMHKYSHTAITSLDGGTYSIAEQLARGEPSVIADSGTVWHSFADWLND